MWIRKCDLPNWIKKEFIASIEVLGEWNMSKEEVKKAKQKAQRDLIGFTLVPVWREDLVK